MLKIKKYIFFIKGHLESKIIIKKIYNYNYNNKCHNYYIENDPLKFVCSNIIYIYKNLAVLSNINYIY